MESLADTSWDVVIEGTGLRQSLLALALSRSDKKILHVDQNEYYGGAEAAFSLQEADEWAAKVAGDSATQPFRNASIWKADADGAEKLSFSRAYTLSLSPQIIYTKSQLLAHLISSKVYKQLEFQAVGNWWICNAPGVGSEATLKRLPNGREDIFEDKSIDLRAKRSLMKFLKFVVDFRNHSETWEAFAGASLPSFLSSQFQLPAHLQTVIIALTLSLNTPEQTTVSYALPRIARHLTSIGVFGPGFGAVLPKWGGGAEIAQVACRSGAVGGGVYVLGTGIRSTQVESDNSIKVALSNGEIVKTKLAFRESSGNSSLSESATVSRFIAVVSTPLTVLFESNTEGSPLAAVSVVVFPPESLSTEDMVQTHPVYIMAHSSETGECPTEQSVLYATTRTSGRSKTLLQKAMETLLQTTETAGSKLLYSFYYEQQESALPAGSSLEATDSLDLAFDDGILEVVKGDWMRAIGDAADDAAFMHFEDRMGMSEEDDGGDNVGY